MLYWEVQFRPWHNSHKPQTSKSGYWLGNLRWCLYLLYHCFNFKASYYWGINISIQFITDTSMYTSRYTHDKCTFLYPDTQNISYFSLFKTPCNFCQDIILLHIQCQYSTSHNCLIFILDWSQPSQCGICGGQCGIRVLLSEYFTFWLYHFNITWYSYFIHMLPKFLVHDLFKYHGKDRKKERSKDGQVHDPASLLYYSQHNG